MRAPGWCAASGPATMPEMKTTQAARALAHRSSTTAGSAQSPGRTFGRRIMNCALALALGVGVTTLGSGCDFFGEPTPDLTNKQHFAGKLVEFDYPGNWKSSVQTETTNGIEIIGASVQSSGAALVIVQTFSVAVPLTPSELLPGFIDGMKRSDAGALLTVQQDGQSDDAKLSKDILGATREGRRLKYTIGVGGVNVAHTVDIYLVELADISIVVYCQAPDSDVAKVSPAFDAVLSSLKRIEAK